MKRLSFLVFFICSFTIEILQIKIVKAADILDVSINNSSKLIKKFALIDTVSSTPRVIEVDADSGSIIWEWKIPSDFIRTHNKRRPICAGAGLTLNEDKSINALIPNFGVVNIQRNGDYEILITDEHIDHTAETLSDGKILFTRGFVDKSVASFIIKNKSNEIVWEWKPENHFRSKKDFSIPGQTCRGALRNASEGEKDWAHANDVVVLENGNFVLSMRNLSLFVEVDSDGRILKQFNTIQGVHQPTPYLGGYLAADRNCGEESLIVLAADGTQKKLFTGEFLLIRSIEPLGGDHFLITSATTISEISLDGKIHYKAHVKGISSAAEIGMTSVRKIPSVGYCGPKTLYQSIPTSFGEITE